MGTKECTILLLATAMGSGILLPFLFLDVHPLQVGMRALASHGLTLKATDLQESQQQRLATLNKVCRQHEASHRTRLPPLYTDLHKNTLYRIYVDDRYSLLYCEVPKVGCTNWKRIILALSRGDNHSMTIPGSQVHEETQNYTRLQQFDAAGRRSRLNGYTAALFVREPMERLVSAYRDKFLMKNDYYQRVYGRYIITCYRKNPSRESLLQGHDVTFSEFVSFILDPRWALYQDVHWLPVHKLCQPCLLHFNFIGKLETMQRDSAALLAKIGAPSWISYSHQKNMRSSANVTHSYLAQLSTEARWKLYRFYYEDYKLFNYSPPHGINIKQRA
ncbi:carbohydrate sulfotransferase 9-like isoform X1 [Lethenteron reissneri]|uniref:carbohydrate sulfotransferase 9-like isoform X1 n=1 Tax=Lethenteron reissneri TaxID=7753 RepID=UPI002AB75A5C|nr:carbohydrate sulfotransferase 9-like isoform X1 [Lethenteron reissneri]XP_061433215.1 carbohydrate sulfotransferase 9-like isoform X1 [Lethenteron reissneri]